MAHLRLIEVGEAEGELRRQYEAATARAGNLFDIVNRIADGVGVEDEPEWRR